MSNKMMEIGFSRGVMSVNRENNMVNLNELIDVGNEYRKARGLREVDVREYFSRPETWEYIDVLNSNSPVSGYLKIENGKAIYGDAIKQTDLIVSKKGRYGGTYADLYIALDIATWINPEFRLEVYKTFIENKIVEVRNTGCDMVKELTSKMKEKFIDINSNDYTSVNIAINRKVNGVFVKGWDIASATADKQQKRLDIIKSACTLIDLNLAKTTEQLITFIGQM